jgi:hypothetical protein
MTDITLMQAIDWLARICFAFSILNAILPPYDVLNDFPSAQKYYKLLLGIVRYFAGDVRTNIMKLYPSFKASDAGVASTAQVVKDLKEEIKDANQK